MAPVLDRALKTLCTDTFGNVLEHGSYASLAKMELDHVPDEGMTAMGDRAVSDQFHLIAICTNHHRLTGWATSKHGRALEREYLLPLRRGV